MLKPAAGGSNQPKIRHEDMEAGRSCGVCHDDESAHGLEDCAACHHEE
jgi:c(7)-type cytochrome triheme protein